MFGQVCRVCGCTDDNCRQCIEKTGEPCVWIDEDLCSACIEHRDKKIAYVECTFIDSNGTSQLATFGVPVTPGKEDEELRVICLDILGKNGFPVVSNMKFTYDYDNNEDD